MARETSTGGGLPTCQICKACLERQKGYSPDASCYGRMNGRTNGRMHGQTDARTDRLIIIERPPQSGRVLIKYILYDSGL
jgi:hypothetical protein